jgi:ADP-heptose:LPS heptosyltransferase
LISVQGVQFVSLQKGPGTEQVRDNFASCFIHPTTSFDEAGPFMDTAAIMQNLDLVISSDTVVPHLAGALGVPVWVALPLAPDWRWLLQRDDTPWYPTMRLFRQTKYGQWEDVFACMAEELRGLLEKLR